jgi:hypothetical protein
MSALACRPAFSGGHSFFSTCPRRKALVQKMNLAENWTVRGLLENT